MTTIESKESPYEPILKELAVLDRNHKQSRESLLNRVPQILRSQCITETWENDRLGRGAHISVWTWTVYVTLRFAPNDSIPDALLFLEKNMPGLDLESVQSNDFGEIYFMWKGIRFCLDIDPSQKCKIVEVSRFKEIRDRRIVCL